MLMSRFQQEFRLLKFLAAAMRRRPAPKERLQKQQQQQQPQSQRVSENIGIFDLAHWMAIIVINIFEEFQQWKQPRKWRKPRWRRAAWIPPATQKHIRKICFPKCCWTIWMNRRGSKYQNRKEGSCAEHSQHFPPVLGEISISSFEFHKIRPVSFSLFPVQFM